MTDQTEPASARIFVSYSRKDRAITDELVILLESHGYDVLFDREDLFPGERFEPRLRSLISDADTIVVVVSSDWLGSEWCRKEYEIAHGLGRRVLPFVVAPVDPARMPGDMGQVQFIHIHGEGRSFALGVADLVIALRTDIHWVREQTRLQGRADEWVVAGRSPALLLRGEALDQARNWIAQPAPDHVQVLPLVAEFITASDDNSRQLRYRQIARRIWVGVISAVALFGVLGSFTFWLQLRNAELQQHVASAESAKEAVVQLAAFDEGQEMQQVTDDPKTAEPRVSAPVAVPEPAPSRGPATGESPAVGPTDTQMEAVASKASNLVAALNSSNKATRLAAGAEVATAVRAKNNTDILEALVSAIEAPNASRLSTTGRFNTLYMLNVYQNWQYSTWSTRLRESLQRLEEKTPVGPQTRDCIDKLQAKLRGESNVADSCGNISNYGLDPKG